MITSTTYGTWLRGDRRGWIDEGRLMPADPGLEAADRARLRHSPFRFERSQLLDVGHIIGTSLVTRMHAPVLALHVGTWHFHIVVGLQPEDVPTAAKCAKDAVRFALLPSRPIWTTGYDKRYCFDVASLERRIRYVERHNESLVWSPRPWDVVTPLDEYLAGLAPGSSNRGRMQRPSEPPV